jgi:hypothetical protein
LFANREEFRDFTTDFPRILPLVAQLSNRSGDQPLETVLSRLADEAREYPVRHSELAAVRYYLQRLIWECERYWHPERKAVTNYLGLLDRVQRWRKGESGNALFVTFNYDRLFEYAASFYLSDAKKIYNNEYTTLDSYISQPAFPLVKVHGSIDWGYRVNTPLDVVQESNQHAWLIAWEVIARFASLDISPEISKITDRPPPPQEGHAYVPALAIPLDKKSDFACPSSHLSFLENQLPQVRTILTVGWRGMEQHFLDRLRAKVPTEARLLTVSGSPETSNETLERLRAAGVGVHLGEAFAGGFSDFVLATQADEFLKGALAEAHV